MRKVDEIIELLGEDSEVLFCDGFDDAIIGVASRINLGPVVAYDVNKIIEIMMVRDGMSYEEALEYYHYNIVGAWYGEYTPIFVETIEEPIELTFIQKVKRFFNNITNKHF